MYKYKKEINVHTLCCGKWRIGLTYIVHAVRDRYRHIYINTYIKAVPLRIQLV